MEINNLQLKIKNSEEDNVSENNLSEDTISENLSISSDTIELNSQLYKDKDILDEFYKLNNLLSYDNMKDVISNDQHNVKFLNRKTYLINHIETKLSKLETKIRLVEKKNTKYKSCYNTVNISIIILSTFLTFCESFKAIYISDITKNNNNPFLGYLFNMIPIGIGSIITCSASILKFKKYQEKMENICKILESASISIINLKKTREKLAFCENIKDYNLIYDNFNNDIYENYINISQLFDRILKKKDYDIHLSDIYFTEYKILHLQNQRDYLRNNMVLDLDTIGKIHNKLKNQDSKKQQSKKCCLC